MKLNVVKQRSLWWSISGAVILAGLIAMAISWSQIGAPLRPGLDFVGGTRLQVERDCEAVPINCTEPVDVSTVRGVLTEQRLENSSIQILGDNRQAVSIRTSTLDVEARTRLQQALEAALGKFDPEATQIDVVGPVIGRQLFAAGLLALLVAFAGITAYLSLRFQFDYAVFSIVALLHDLLVTLGVFAVLGLVLGTEVDSLFVVALLTIVGFSVNDTVVIYDRIRETIKYNPQRHIDEIVDDSVNQTLARSINTTLTTVLTLTAIFLFGGETLKFFALALIIGFMTGAYSSIFIASTLLAWWRERSGRAIAGVEETTDSPENVV
ncbi:MAG: protein translocase subunit SecF [Leptolyngbyaceae cyanobacterium SL_1_1]|nr:protein translocase subunit SecF [Leptolyngbyaceae cyanobacterium RM1_1_2]NJO08789.1 protein translocase subunit SecF [Leptolyngbyaceae cyanobacterium SL_1_1]